MGCGVRSAGCGVWILRGGAERDHGFVMDLLSIVKETRTALGL